MKKKTAKESPFSKLIQVGVVVKNLDKAVERLSSLGIGPFTPMLLPPDAEQWFRGKPLDAKFKISGARLGEVVLELIQPVEGKSPHQEFLDSQSQIRSYSSQEILFKNGLDRFRNDFRVLGSHLTNARGKFEDAEKRLDKLDDKLELMGGESPAKLPEGGIKNEE